VRGIDGSQRPRPGRGSSGGTDGASRPEEPRAPGTDAGPTWPLEGTPTLTVWVYDSPMGAAAGEVRLKDLRQRGAITVHDAVTVIWVFGAHQPRIGHLRHATSAAAVRGSVLGALVGALVLTPAVDAAAGSGIGGLAYRLRGTGIDQRFLAEVRSSLTPGSSALLVLSSDADLDAVRPVIERGLARGDVRLLHALLTGDAPEALRRILHGVPPSG
jgi:uncharacterized membrane protein